VSDRASGFDFSQAPLVRLISLADHSLPNCLNTISNSRWVVKALLVLEGSFFQIFTKRFVSVKMSLSNLLSLQKTTYSFGCESTGFI